jgi:HAD superfamily hydrolase (TIGR01490 family)
METIFSKDNNIRENYFAFFDLDQTIADSISGKSLANGAFRKGLLTTHDLINAIIASIQFRLKLRDPIKIIDEMVNWVKGIPENSLADLCSEISKEVIIPSIYKEAISEIEFHKSKNARIVILSSALTFVCHELAVYLKIDDVICSELEVRDGYLTGKPVGHICFGEEKAVRLQEYCIINNSPQSDAWYYADSISDLPALKEVGNPVCVNPDKKLKKTAIEKNWKILKWKN